MIPGFKPAHAPYVRYHEEGIGPAGRVEVSLEVDISDFDWRRLGFYMLGGNVTAIQLPCHDPPVAWRVEKRWGQWPIQVVVCPAFPEGKIGIGEMDIPILDGEPGRR